MKKQNGITLISLVVTIIVLIILAGISINLTLGQDGIITKAREAKQNMEFAQVEEQEQLNQLYSEMTGESVGSTSDDAISKLVEFKKQIASAITDMGVATSENAEAETMLNNIRSIVGSTTAEKVSYDNTNSGLTATNVQTAMDEINNSIDEVENGIKNKVIYGNTETSVETKVFTYAGEVVANQVVDFGKMNGIEGTIVAAVCTPHANINGVISLYVLPQNDGWHVYCYSDNYTGPLNYSAMIAYIPN